MYLIRSLGTIYGVTSTAAIVQNVLVSRLSSALGSASSPELIERIRQSVWVINELPPEAQLAVRGVYCDALRIAFVASSGFAFVSFAFSWLSKTGALKRKA